MSRRDIQLSRGSRDRQGRRTLQGSIDGEPVLLLTQTDRDGDLWELVGLDLDVGGVPHQAAIRLASISMANARYCRERWWADEFEVFAILDAMLPDAVPAREGVVV